MVVRHEFFSLMDEFFSSRDAERVLRLGAVLQVSGQRRGPRGAARCAGD
jgi:hypothetical protein